MRKRFFNSIYFKFILIFLSILFFSATVTFSVVNYTQFGNFFDEARSELVNQTEAVQTLSQKGLSNEEIVALFNKGVMVSWTVSTLNETGFDLSEEDRQTIENGGTILSHQRNGNHLPGAIGKIQNGYAVTSVNIERQQISGFFDRQKATLLLMLMVGTVLTLIMVAMIVKPIKAVSEATKKVAEGDFDLRLKVKGNDELAVLARNFNIMTEALSKNDYIHRDFVSNVSHEFKTPIASIKGFGNLLKDPHISEKQRQEYVDIIVDESDRLWKLSSNVLKLSELENGILGLKKELFSLDEEIRRVVLLLQEKWETKNIDLDIQMDEIVYRGDEEMMAQVIINIFTNAINHSPADGTINIELHGNTEEIVIKIKNSGAGISREEQEKIFDRFYKVDQSRSTPGTGLGLTISQRIVNLHGGSITVESVVEESSTFIIKLPR
ncbi:HAMP domain-containing sensor histidine kinase [Acetobacterium tundrae]|uniref:Heme sensor protein HssS n=1 Tax=Acetobacterium tundrae TaxID=132932 RepID=A0ABR6WKB7_9FIRM|nr:HAMP domain-containing sensor histidine kinase [Acetobacterium tundrae]MBC3796721.1 HAMP domain-containing protein [Acetobacterium tundrae]